MPMGVQGYNQKYELNGSMEVRMNWFQTQNVLKEIVNVYIESNGSIQ